MTPEPGNTYTVEYHDLLGRTQRFEATLLGFEDPPVPPIGMDGFDSRRAVLKVWPGYEVLAAHPATAWHGTKVRHDTSRPILLPMLSLEFS